VKQEPRPAYHRRQDVARLAHFIEEELLPLRVTDEHACYVVRMTGDERVLVKGRYEVVHSYLVGFRDAMQHCYERWPDNPRAT
jgi:hypothetical protein